MSLKVPLIGEKEAMFQNFRTRLGLRCHAELFASILQSTRMQRNPKRASLSHDPMPQQS